MTELLRELEAVVGLADKATPGPWVANGGELATDLYWANGSMTADALAEFADGLSDPPNAPFVEAAVNFLRTHHAEIAEAVRDARRYRWLRDEAHKEPHTRSVGIYCEWGSNCDLSSIGGTDADVEIDAAIDAHNSAREVGE